MQTKWPGPAEESGSPVGMQVGGLVMAQEGKRGCSSQVERISRPPTKNLRGPA